MKTSAFEDFSESALEALDFARCQRPDGSFYGTSGQCRKGAPVDPREKKEAKAKDKKAELKKADALVAKLQEVNKGNQDIYSGAQDALDSIAEDLAGGYDDIEKFPPHTQLFASDMKSSIADGEDPQDVAENMFESVANNGGAGFRDAYALATNGRDLSDDSSLVVKAYKKAGLSQEEAEEKGYDFYDSFTP